MCGRYTVAVDPQLLAERFNVALPEDIVPRFNVAPTDPVLALAERSAGRELMVARWGLIPRWAKEAKIGARMINARAETLDERSAYRPLLAKGRCLILADGFYEWQRAPTGPKQPFHITREDRALFAFAGLWSIWHRPDGSKLRTCTIITRAANSALADLHDRMPVILAPADEREWLDTSTSSERRDQILTGLPAARTSLTRVGLAVNDARYDGPECLAPPAEDPQTALF